MDVGNITSDQYWGNTAAKEKSKLDMNEFLQLLAVQMENQNPLEPMNDRDFFAQMAQLGQVQGMDQINKNLEVTQITSLIGKTVTAVRPMSETGTGFNEMVEGKVTSMVVKNGQYYLGVTEANGGLVEIQVAAIHSVKS
jgi:flagellar basal-body rod modification protein FlgD